ncbi:MAG: hypothetical protein ACRES4_02245 [Nevskiales bacterium]
MRDYPDSICFSSKLLFEDENIMTRWLHSDLGMALQRRLHLDSQQLVIVPIRLLEFTTAPAST